MTNGIGGFASGTIAGLLTRRYHGLLVGALRLPLARTLLLAKLDETALYDGRSYPLATNRWADSTLDPHGYRYLERFSLEGTTPVWTFACADALLEKRVWMQPGANTTYIRYDLLRGSRPLQLSVKALVNYRDYHANTHANGWRMRIEPVPHGLRVTPFDGATPFYLLSDGAQAVPAHDWYYGFDLAVEHERGLDHREDHLHAGTFHATLEPGSSLAFIASTEAEPDLDGTAAYAVRRAHEQKLLELWRAAQPTAARQAPGWVEHLVLAADQFVVNRPLPSPNSEMVLGHSVIAGYHWFGDWGRDTMISLPGLALSTGRPEVAASILRTFARLVDQGMLPNRFPEFGEVPEFNTVDATLWYFDAVRAYHAVTGDDGILHELLPVLADLIAWHQRGTRYNIHVDPDDGLLYAGEAGVQLTWMDAKVGDWVVTPRIGKPVEVNALWYNALRAMAAFARRLGEPAKDYDAMAERAAAGFARFWNEGAGYCYDVLDGPAGHDPSLRPNQIFAVSLSESPLTPQRQRMVLEACARQLLTSHGLRSLAADHPEYHDRYEGGPFQRDSAYHQGMVWGWLLGPFVLGYLRVHGDPAMARTFLEPMAHHLEAYGIGTLGEIFDGDPPFRSHGAIAQAWTVAEVLRAWLATATAA